MVIVIDPINIYLLRRSTLYMNMNIYNSFVISDQSFLRQQLLQPSEETFEEKHQEYFLSESQSQFRWWGAGLF